MASTSIQTVPSSFTSAFPKPQPEYDVFLSFRGEDTRCNFTDHLYYALVDKEIITFRDDKVLKMGDSISQELLEAIEKSRIAVIIFSKNYASSTWCLEELAKIVECRDRGILRVLPIFYHVEPTDVRHQTNTFEGAFTEHEKCFKENPEKVQKWKAALTSVANLTGKPLKDGVHEANFIQSFVERLYSILKEKRSNDIEDDLVGISSKDDLVGISSRVEKMILNLDLKSTDVRFIGICEKSGMGKTTLARAVFDKILNEFEACSFLENVTEESKTHGLKTLQERLLCDIGKGGLRVKDVHKGMQLINDILHNKKVLIVVDDVSETSQLETLVGKHDLFGKGSRIIVTTEKKDLLASYEIKIVYEVSGLDKVEALQLFSLNAFHKPHCENDFLDYCNNFVEYAQRIPLVLKVLGSSLCTRTKNEWESAQNQLRAIPHEETTKKLRIAFDGLGANEKKLFLYIACFFKGEEKNRVADILESVYFEDINLKNLIDKSLITLVGGGRKLWMHNLLQQMGWEIVTEDSKEARECSRLWCCDDVLDVLKKNTGTKHIEGMLLRFPPDEEVELNAESFSKMKKLRLLKICKVRLSCLSHLSNELRLLEWHDCPLESLPNSFQPGELVELIMHRSCLQQLPSKFGKLGKLKHIDLSDSQNLTRTPDFTGFSNIERLNFQGCTGLHELHPSVGGLKRLILLNLKDCKCLKNLPYELNLESLKTLILSGCSRFKKFPRIGRNMRSLLELYLDGTAIEELPPTITRLTGLTLLNLRDCKNLKSFLSEIHSLTSLEILTLSGCKCQPPKVGHLLGLSHIGSSIGATLTFPRPISFLFLSFLAWRYTYLRIPICATTALSTYCFRNARHPEPEPINLLSNLFSKLSTLVSLDLSDCNLLALPDDLSCFSSIKSLNLSKNNFIHLPDCISQLSRLKILFLDHCSKLKSWPYVPLSARFVSVQGCTSLENYSNQVVVWTSGVAGFTIITCLGLAEDEDVTIAEVSLLGIHLLWQRYVKDQIHQMEGFCHVLPQVEIPECFTHQRCGSFRPIPLSSNLFSNKNWKGIALCVIFVVPAHSNDVSPGEDTKYFHEFYCRLDINGDLIAFKVPKETYVGSFGLWLYISHARFRKHLDERSCITPLIGTNSPDIEIKMCGARILCKQDMGEFLENLGQKIVGSPNDLRGELNSHSQLSRLHQVDWKRNNLSDYIFPQNASPPRSFAYQNGPAIKTQLPADLHDYSRWRPTPVIKLLPSNETIQGECISRETIFSNQVIAAGTSKSSRQGSIYLGKISSSLECWSNHRPYLQDHYEGPGTFNQCLNQSEIPGWFNPENIARSSSVTIQLPQDLYGNLDWMGFAFCAVFSFQKHPTSVPMKGSEFSFIIVCHLKTDFGCMNPLYSISEEDVILSLHQRGFLWLSFIPCWFLSPEWSRCTRVEFSFVSDSSAVSALKCGVDLVYWKKLEFTRRMVQCITSYGGPFTSYERFPFYHPDQFSGSNGSSGTSGHCSYDQFYKTAALDFHPSTSYNFCFPPSKIQDWFSRPNHGHSVTIDLPSNLYHDSNWMGLVLYASFSIHGDPNIIFSNLASGKSHFLFCRCQTSMVNVDDQTIAFSTNKEEITWLLNLGEFIWICYVPGEPFKNMLPHCSHIEASFMSDWSGVIVQNCALQLLYQHDQVQFAQELKHCNNLISENRKFVCKQQEDQKKKNEQYHVDEGLQRKIFSNIDFEVKICPRLIDLLETDETEIQLGQSDLLGFVEASCSIFCCCFQQSFEKLKIIQMNGCPNLIETPDLIEVPNLEKMVLEDCLNLREIHPSTLVHNGLTLLNLKGCVNVKALPSKFKMESLEVLILSGCSKLKKIPEFGENMQHVLKLYLGGTAITKLPISIGHLTSLVLLNVRDCKNLMCLPSSIFNLKLLKDMNISGCSKLDELPKNVGCAESVEELDMSGTAIRNVPSSIGLLKNLKVLSFKGCNWLSSINSKSRFDLLPFACMPKIANPLGLSSLLGLCSLIELNLQNCNLYAIPDDIGCLFSLEEIDLSENSFVCLPDSISRLCKLERMYLRNCTSLRSLPNLPVDIVEVWGDGCTSLETVPDLQKPNSFFKGELYLSNCCKLADNQDFIDIFFAMIRKHHQGFHRHGRYDHRLYNWRYDMIISGSEIPNWFSHQNIGAEVNVIINSRLCDDWMGIAVCVVFSSLLNFSLSSRLIANGKVMSATADFVQTADFVNKIGCLSENIWLCYLLPQYYEDIKLLNECEANELCQIGIKIETSGSCMVKKCGLRMVYKNEIEGLNQTMAQSSNISITPYEDFSPNFDNLVGLQKITKQIRDNFEGSCNDVPHPKRIERLHGDSDCEEYFECGEEVND